MYKMLAFASLIVMSACMSEDKFAEKSIDKACEACEGQGDFDCAALETADTTAVEGCEFDAKAAKECLKGEWTCNTDFDPIVYPEGPAVCADVYVCDGATGTNTGTGTGTATGTE